MWHLVFHLVRLLIPKEEEKTVVRQDLSMDAPERQKFIGYLENKGYFKYTSDNKIPLIKEAFNASLLLRKGLITIDDPASGIPYDYRLYELNGEKLAEKGGLITSLKPLKKTFEKLMIPMIWTNESMISTGDRQDYRISLNGKEYTIYKGNSASPARAGIIKMNVAEMLNDQLKLSGSDEKVYLLSSVNHGRIIFLTKKLHKRTAMVIKDGDIQPMKPRDWAQWQHVI